MNILKKRIIIKVNVVLLAILVSLIGVCAYSGTKFSNYNLTGLLTLKNPHTGPENTLMVYRSRAKESSYILRVQRNSIDSKFMNPGVEFSGWVDIPIPLPFIDDIRKKHVIKYVDSDKDWDYFKMDLQ